LRMVLSIIDIENQSHTFQTRRDVITGGNRNADATILA
jgi:hypothetical protein